MNVKASDTVHRKDSGADKRLHETRSILLARGLIEPDEEVTVEMLEDLVHFAYFTGCVSKREVKRLLDLTQEQATAKLRAWKRWQEGNRSCNLRQNPFYEGWAVKSARGRHRA